MRKVKVIILFLIIIFLTEMIINPYRYMTPNMIKSYLKSKIPYDSTMDKVNDKIKEMGFKTLYISDDCGYDDSEIDTGGDLPKEIGEKYISVHLCEYSTFLLVSTDVIAYFAFDNNLRLVDIGISKVVDSL